MAILKDISGIIKPRRMTLLLGPPGSGKTTLLLALSGKLDSSLQVNNLYNSFLAKRVNLIFKITLFLIPMFNLYSYLGM